MSTSLAPKPISVKPGDVLAGKYRVERVLGEGGMGIVVAAHHIQLDERVALKFIQGNALGHAERIGRFVREARAAVKIKSEHVARVTDVATLEDGTPYMVMEYLEGSDLGQWLDRHGAMPLEQAVDFVLQACEAIAQAHTLGIVHRDLKPANLFCIRRPDGQPSIKVLDFGISKLIGSNASDQDLTKTLAVMGSPQYMSPEQMRGSKEIDSRADIWALGAILYELVSTRMPFDAPTVTALAIRVTSEEPVPLEEVAANTPPAFAAVVMRCLEKDVAKRYQDVGMLASALAPFGSRRAAASVERIRDTLLASGALSSPPVTVSMGAGSALPAPHSESWAKTGAEIAVSVMSRTALAAVVGVALLVSLVAGRLWMNRRVATTAIVAASGSVSGSVSASAPPPAAPVVADPRETAPAVVRDVPPVQPPAPPVSRAATVAPPVTRPVAALPPPVQHLPQPHAAESAPPSSSVHDCDPPYTINDKGSRIYKKECL